MATDRAPASKGHAFILELPVHSSSPRAVAIPPGQDSSGAWTLGMWMNKDPATDVNWGILSPATRVGPCDKGVPPVLVMTVLGYCAGPSCTQNPVLGYRYGLLTV